MESGRGLMQTLPVFESAGAPVAGRLAVTDVAGMCVCVVCVMT